MERSRSRLGVVVNRSVGVEAALAAAAVVENLGFGAAWLTSGSSEDCMPLSAAIVSQTTGLKIGTSVVQTYPRHPVVLAAEANVIDQLGPGRFRLGIGPSHDVIMQTLGIRRENPLMHLSEYLRLLRLLLSGDPVDFSETYYQAHITIGRKVTVPVMIGALQPKTFELAGGHSDGAITWLCPPRYIADVALLHLRRGADAAGCQPPPLVAHLAVCVSDDASEVRAAVRSGIPNIRFPAYQRMLVRAGLDEARHGEWTDSLIDQVIAWGSPNSIADRVEEMFGAGADEVLLRTVETKNTADTNERSLRRTLELLCEVL